MQTFKIILILPETDLDESNDIQRLLSGELREILMAELFTLDESICELKEDLKMKFQVKHVEYVWIDLARLCAKLFLFLLQNTDEKEKQAELKKDVDILQVLVLCLFFKTLGRAS